MPYPGLLHPEPLSLWQFTVELYLHRRHSNTVLSQSLWGPRVLSTQGLFEPSEHLCWEWGLILNLNSPLLLSCWDFSIVLRHRVSPYSCSSTYHFNEVSLLKEVTIIFLSSTIVWSQVNSREGTQIHPSTENWIKDLVSMALPFRTRPSFPLSQSLPSESFHNPFIFLHQRSDRLKTTITENQPTENQPI